MLVLIHTVGCMSIINHCKSYCNYETQSRALYNSHHKFLLMIFLCVSCTVKPECKIDRTDGGSGEDAYILLICRAEANPQEVTFR